MGRFVRYQLRTTDIDAARSFYSELLGAGFWRDSIDIAPLPTRAAARGAPPHWLGYIGVDDVVGAELRFLSHGATQLGPGVLRDPFGALVGLAPHDDTPQDDRVAWHLLHTRDEADSFSVYADLFGWTPLEMVELDPRNSRYQMFAWNTPTVAVGCTSDTARLPHVHPQWLFFFRTEHLDRSLAVVREMGGLTLATSQTANGDRVAPCDDPQGAAFALFQPRAR
ncbi:MAG TPA: hypothetical protein VFP91_12000 [Vicinamibacterales bacterium]|nr:hypothetical protein [Vicinamibacterales bacterium]